jgi:hypothetical protein
MELTMTACMPFTGKIYSLGYGQSSRNGKTYFAHRDAWEQVNGSIPKGFVIDHTCHNEAVAQNQCNEGVACSHRACVNVEHLRLVSQAENVRAGKHGFDSRSACPKGHSYLIEGNVLQRKDGRRECAECNRVRANAVYAAKKLVSA